jgi:hypothetical protein
MMLELLLLASLQWFSFGVMALSHCWWKLWHLSANGEKFVDSPFHERVIVILIIILMGPVGYVWMLFRGT